MNFNGFLRGPNLCGGVHRCIAKHDAAALAGGLSGAGGNRS